MKSKYDKDLKCSVLDNGLIKDIIVAKRDLYYKNLETTIDLDTGVVLQVCNNTDWYNYVIENRSKSDFDCAFLLLDSKKRKARKVREKIADLIMTDSAVFLTLTFRDEIFEKTTQATRRRYVARFLKKTSAQYVANIDFSPDIAREHYHAVVISRVDLNAWKYGFSYAEKVRCHKGDLQRVSKYITKLTSHALKVDATRLIYSRL